MAGSHRCQELFRRRVGNSAGAHGGQDKAAITKWACSREIVAFGRVRGVETVAGLNQPEAVRERAVLPAASGANARGVVRGVAAEEAQRGGAHRLEVVARTALLRDEIELRDDVGAEIAAAGRGKKIEVDGGVGEFHVQSGDEFSTVLVRIDCGIGSV